MENIAVIEKAKKLKFIPDDYVLIDIETTGFKPEFESIIEISALKVIQNEVKSEFSMLVKPKRQIPWRISNLTGITNKMVENASDIEPVLKKFYDFIEDYTIVGHNVRFDLAFLNHNLNERLNLKILNNYADTLYFARRVYRELPSRKLTAIAEYLNIDTKNAHRALSDCYMTYQIIQDMKKSAY